jgi:hypothetical protein
MKPLLLILLLGNCVLLVAQTFDQFTDGDFFQNPTWIGDDSLFQVNGSHQLQSKGTIAKDIMLATSSSTTAGEWRFWCRFSLSPSTSNFMRVYLMSDTSNLKGAVTGYYAQLGGVTGSTDSITLYKQKGNTRTRIIGGRASTVSKSVNTVRIKVLRDGDGNWQLFSDTTGGFSFVLEGTGVDAELANSAFMGVFVRFTSSNAQNYLADDLYAGPVQIDVTPPSLDSVQVLSANQLRLVFSENISAHTGLNLSSYHLNQNLGSPVAAVFESGRNDVVRLTFNQPFPNNTYHLTVDSITDISGNRVNLLQIDFTYFVYRPNKQDVLITEFFPDPTPSTGLPEVEFVELFNHTTVPMQLKGWTISDGSTTATLPFSILNPNQYVIVCAASAISLFQSYGNTIGVSSLPSLNNSNDQLILKDSFGTVIHQLSYDLSWYQQPAKSDGGYTIEMDNPEQLCKGKQNFGASDAFIGGTPGTTNSRWQLQPDTVAPKLKSIVCLDNKTLQLVFNEPMDSVTLVNGSIFLNPSNTITSQRVSSTMDTVWVFLLAPMVSKIMNTLTLTGFKDCSGNEMTAGVVDSFMYLTSDTARVYDVLINEIMADPDPMIGLPDAEYVELYNRSDRLISLGGWTLSDANTSAKLPSVYLWPDSFVVVTAIGNLPKFTFIGNIVGVGSFPSLGNEGDVLTLKDALGNTIHHLRYTDAAYQSAIKKKGGWSLELVDALNPCGNDQNLSASIDITGGTPGRINAAAGRRKDKSAPQLVSAYPINTHVLELRLNESIDSTTLGLLTSYAVNNGIGNPIALKYVAPDFQRIFLTFQDSFDRNTQYRIILSEITDCAGNKIGSSDYADFGLPVSIAPNDLVINEILFDPKGDGSDFIEVYNRSNKIIDLKNLFIANTNDDGSIKDFYPIDSTGLLFLPQTYLVLTDNPTNIKSEYSVPQPQNLIQCKLPSFSNTAGTCVLIDKMGNRFDEFTYSDEMHYPLLDTKDGVSLERIDANRPTADRTNWTSASSTSGYATPTYRNSQFASVESDGILHVEPEVFSPDGDGWNDEVHFSYEMESSGFTGNMTIYNSSGYPVKRLLKNELLGSRGVFSWNGFTDDGNKASIGIYICYFEAFHLSGKVVKKKVSTVVGGKL